MTDTIIEILDFVNHKNYNEEVRSTLKTTNQFQDYEGGVKYRENLTKEMPNNLKRVVSSIVGNSYVNYTFASGIGEGNISAVPHNSILHNNITETTRSGVYITLFYVADGSGVYLSLQQGVATIKEEVNKILKATTNNLLRSLALDYRNKLIELNIDLSEYLFEIELGSTLTNPKSYEAANIIAKYYDRADIHNITDDIAELIKIYKIFVDNDLYIDNEYNAVITLESVYESTDQKEFRFGKKKEQRNYDNIERDIKGLSKAKNAKGARAEKKVIDKLRELFEHTDIVDKSKVSCGYDIMIKNNENYRGIEVKNISQKNRSCFYISGNESDKLERGISRLILVDNNQFYLSKDINQTTHLKKIIEYFNNEYLYDPEKWNSEPYTLESDSIQICFHSPSFYEDFVSFSSLEHDGTLTKEHLINFLNIE